MKPFICFLLCIFLYACVTVKRAPVRKAPVATPASDSARRATARINDSVRAAQRSEIKPYGVVVNKNYATKKGLFTVHQFKDSVLFEIPDSLLERDIMVISRIRQTTGGFGAYPGEKLDEKTILFEKGPNATILLKFDLIISEADSTSDLYRNVVNSNINPIIVALPIKAYSKDSSSYVVDASKLLRDNTSFINSIEQSRALTQVMDQKSFKDASVEAVHAYPINVEIGLTKSGTSKGTLTESPQPFTLVTNTSFVLLPKVPMQRRYYDARVGYFADYYYAYGDQQQKAEVRQFILRWRLEPRAADVEKWKRGELVEPATPIVFYIDPATPKQWRKYLIMGINDWQAAFEQAGFKHAIIGKEWPEHDSTMHMEDARFSILHYFPSENRNAYGPQVHDPRSGEIIQSRIGWYHSVMQLLHNWYMIQAGAADPKARTAKFDDELMGQLVRFVSSHEVGHTLGLRHNFGSSSQTPVDSLRSKTWLQAHGHTASIMDYARFNYVAQPEDHIPQEQLFPHIGEYDRWAVQWGYSATTAVNAEEDRKIITRWIIDSLSHNPRLWFADGGSKKTDPRCQSEDLGDNPVKAGTYGIKNLQRILPQLPEWSREPDGVYLELKESYEALKGQYHRYLNHAMKYLGGIYYTIQSEEQTGEVYTTASRSMQKDALAFINAQLFTTPHWLLDKKVTDKITEPAFPDFVEDLQVRMINTLLSSDRLLAITATSYKFGPERSLGIDEYVAILHQYVWSDLRKEKVVMDNYRRNLQKSYLGCIQEILVALDAERTENDMHSVLHAEMEHLQKEIAQAIPKAGDALTRYHLTDIATWVKKSLSAK